MSTNATVTKNDRSSTELWAWHLGALAALLALTIGIFWFEVSHAVEVWWIYPTYSHCFLIIPIVLWLIWEKRDELRTEIPALATKALFIAPFVLAIWYMARIATVNEVRQLAVIGLVQIAILTMLGTRIYRTILFPVLFLFFLVPVGQYLIPPMQRFATVFTDVGLTFLGIVHYTEGTLIELTTGLFEIAEACAGLRFLIATVTLGMLFAHLAYRKWWKVGLFLAACVVVPLVANGFRCIGIIALAHFTNNAAAVAADHIIYGWVFNAAILLIVFFIGSRFRDDPTHEKHIAAANAKGSSPISVVGAVVTTAFAISAGPALGYWSDNRPVIADVRTFTAPLALSGWTVMAEVGPWRPIYSDPDRELNVRLLQAGGSSPPVDLAIVYYGRSREGRSLIASTNRLWDGALWRHVDGGSVVANLGLRPIVADETIISSLTERRLIWSFYWMDERFTTSDVVIKLLQLKTAFIGNEASALIAFSTPIDGAVEDARSRLRSAMAPFADLPKDLTLTGRENIASDVLD